MLLMWKSTYREMLNQMMVMRVSCSALFACRVMFQKVMTFSSVMGHILIPMAATKSAATPPWSMCLRVHGFVLIVRVKGQQHQTLSIFPQLPTARTLHKAPAPALALGLGLALPRLVMRLPILILIPAYLHSARLLNKTPISYSCLVWPWWGAAWQPEWTGGPCALKHKYHHQQHFFGGWALREAAQSREPLWGNGGGGLEKGLP